MHRQLIILPNSWIRYILQRGQNYPQNDQCYHMDIYETSKQVFQSFGLQWVCFIWSDGQKEVYSAYWLHRSKDTCTYWYMSRHEYKWLVPQSRPCCIYLLTVTTFRKTKSGLYSILKWLFGWGGLILECVLSLGLF